MTHYIITFIIGAQVGGIIALLLDQRNRRLFREEYTNKLKELPVATKMAGETLNDLNELMEWLSSPRVHWDNFAITIPIKNPNEIKWFALGVEEA